MSLPNRHSTLVDALRDVLVADLESRGFTRLSLSPEDAKSAEIRSSFPFGRLRRGRPGGSSQIEVQFDRRQPMSFRLNLGFVPTGGIQHEVTGHVPEADVWVHYLREYGVLYASAWTRRWFSVDRKAGESNLDLAQACQALAKHVVSLLPEVDAALDSGCSPRWFSHVRWVRA